jgi:hypothetical protein
LNGYIEQWRGRLNLEEWEITFEIGKDYPFFPIYTIGISESLRRANINISPRKMKDWKVGVNSMLFEVLRIGSVSREMQTKRYVFLGKDEGRFLDGIECRIFASPEIAAFYLPYYRLLMPKKEVVLWEAEGELEYGPYLSQTYYKYGYAVRRLACPKITTEQRVEIAIRVAALFSKDAGFIEWGRKWLSGEDRSYESAQSRDSWEVPLVEGGALEAVQDLAKRNYKGAMVNAASVPRDAEYVGGDALKSGFAVGLHLLICEVIGR